VLNLHVLKESLTASEQKILFPYQEEAVEKIFSKLKTYPPGKNLLFQLPTGGGKTHIFSEIARRYIEEFRRKVLILTHRIELSRQTHEILKEFGVENMIISSEVKQLPVNSSYMAFTALVETLNNRLQNQEEFLEDIGLIIVDEAHHNSFRKLFHYFSRSNILGVTATPLSSNKRYPLYQTYSELIVGESIASLIDKKYLCDAKTYTYDVNLSSLRIGSNGEFTVSSHELLYTQYDMLRKLHQAYEEVARGTKTLIFNAGILTSRAVYEYFKTKGYPIRHLDSTFSDKERKEVLDWFNRTDDGILTSVSILTTGFDQPDVRSIILNRATRSLTLYHQMIGRGSRPIPGKEYFNVVDLGNNVRRFNYWQFPIDWMHVFVAPHLYLDFRYQDEWDYEAEHDYELPEEIKQRFVQTSRKDFIVKQVYLENIREGHKPSRVLELSLEDQYQRIIANASSLEEAMELFDLLNEETHYRIRQFAKCINATENYVITVHQQQRQKLKNKIWRYFMFE
jgi:superfamily II DNA or RNA helicase